MSEVRITDPRTGGAKGRKDARMELLPWDSLTAVAEVYAAGAAKYEDRNWEKGYAWGLSFGAMQRHCAAFWSGEDMDPESGLPHMAHATFHALALLRFMRAFPELDDRGATTCSPPIAPAADECPHPEGILKCGRPMGDCAACPDGSTFFDNLYKAELRAA